MHADRRLHKIYYLQTHVSCRLEGIIGDKVLNGRTFLKNGKDPIKAYIMNLTIILTLELLSDVCSISLRGYL